MQEKSPNRFLDQIEVLVRHEVDFIIVGGVAAVLAGAPIITMDLDIAFDRSAENIPRLVRALEELDAHYKDPAGRRIAPDAARLSAFKTNLLLTNLGGLDVLTSLDPGFSYEDLRARSSAYELAGMRLRVLDLDAVIESKEAANRDKDRAVLPILRRTLELKKDSV